MPIASMGTNQDLIFQMRAAQGADASYRCSLPTAKVARRTPRERSWTNGPMVEILAPLGSGETRFESSADSGVW